jgi:hypothetical protein
MPQKIVLSAMQIERALAARFRPPEFAFFAQLRDATGFLQSRTADAIAMNLYPSRGLDIHGFEIKASRGDWKKELDNPDKAEAIARYCHYWWIVAPSGMIAPEEVPGNWGLMEVMSGDRTRTKKHPVQVDAVPIGYPFLASILRKTNETTVPKKLVDERISEAITRDRERRRDQELYELSQLRDRTKTYAEFEHKSGVRISAWNLDRIASVVRMLDRHEVDPDYYLKRLQEVSKSTGSISRMIEDSITALESVVAEMRDDPIRDPHQAPEASPEETGHLADTTQKRP